MYKLDVSIQKSLPNGLLQLFVQKFKNPESTENLEISFWSISTRLSFSMLGSQSGPKVFSQRVILNIHEYFLPTRVVIAFVNMQTC